VNKLRAENPDGTVLIDGGDCFQGTMISNLQFGRPVVEQMNAMRYSAMAVGNHEFDWSADTLEHRVRAMNFAALGANMIELKTKHRPRWARADTVVTRKGVRLGVLGLCYRFTPTVTLAKNVAHLRFEDDSATAVRLVPELAKRSDIVIGVGHIPAESDSAYGARSGDLPRLARGVPGVTAWFGGHSHNLVSDRVNGVPVMIAGSHGEAVAVCDLVIDPIAHKAVDSRIALVRTGPTR
jgi:2',3'-cyclic-nucleotide 2'-phosphodiesterase (5'-nucleotidase family)